MLYNLQHRLLYRIQQLTTDHIVPHPDISIGGERVVLFQKPFLDISNDTEACIKAKITRHGKKKNEKDETGTIYQCIA